MNLARILLFIFLASLPLCSQTARSIHVFVALADNANQGIVPVPAKLGNGEDAVHNLYWGSAFGVKTFFSRSADWKLVSSGTQPRHEILERCVWRYRNSEVYLVADAYRGREIQAAILNFLDAAAGLGWEEIDVAENGQATKLAIRGGSSLVAYVGHDGLMDFQLPRMPHKKGDSTRQAIILACASKIYFAPALRTSGAYPLLWTTNLMAPEAYTLKAALDGWIAAESAEQIHERAAVAYDKYQKCGLKAARKLMATGW